eukprot:GHVS01009556.1.p2 GENE.GHVS01009556.1~~GHVS01009556.1.p2  ORF type:complete len:102 (+),score=5.42 GHVS01009556.1:567-872(+)
MDSKSIGVSPRRFESCRCRVQFSADGRTLRGCAQTQSVYHLHRRSLSIVCTDAVCLSSAQTQSVYHLHRRSLSIICTDASALDGSIQNLFASFATFSSSEN